MLRKSQQAQSGYHTSMKTTNRLPVTFTTPLKAGHCLKSNFAFKPITYPLQNILNRQLSLPSIVRPYSDAHPELKAELEELQKHMNERGYAFPLTVDAPIPGSEHPIDQVKAKQWIQAHPEGVAQEVAQSLIDHTTYISFEAFETELKRSVASLNEKLRENPTQPFIVIAREKKSNGWVAALAMRYLERLPDQIVDMEEKT